MIWKQIAVCLAFACTNLSTQSTVVLDGVIKDTEGARIPRAFIVVHPDTAGLVDQGDKREVRTLSSDARGEFSLPVKTGFYDICVMSSSFIPVCKKIRFETGHRSKIQFVLEISPEIEKLLGDQIL